MNEKYFKQVSEDDFNDFIRNYKGNLTPHLTTICFPEVLGYYDFSLEKDKWLVCGESYAFEIGYENEYKTYFIEKSLAKKYKKYIHIPSFYKKTDVCTKYKLNKNGRFEPL